MIRIFLLAILFTQFSFGQNVHRFVGNYDFEDIINQGIIDNIQSNFDIDFDQVTKQFSGKRALTNAPELYEKVRNSVVLIATTNGASGSGSVLDKNGYVITNFHVIEGQTGDTIRCILFDESFSSIEDIPKSKLLKVEIVGTDSEKDLALLKIVKKIPNLKPILFGKSYSIKIAQDVFAVGHPNGYLWYYTNGTINRIAKHEWTYGENFNVKANTIFTQTPINPGNSGGPLLDSKGKMIGVNSATDLNMENVNMSIRIDEVERFVSAAKKGSLSKKTSISKPSLYDAKWEEIDKNKNGITDFYVREGELDNGKYIVQIGVDENEDGVIDFIACDTNSDGEADIVMYDKKRDGQYSFWEIDEDYDGKFEQSKQL
tara:strand:+ start:799 stop:1917 length:1119 start_codon:yes stop_codon:yes gene_type:complete